MDLAQKPSPLRNGTGEFRVGGRMLARNTAINLAGRVVPLLVAVIALPYTVRHLGPDRFGVLSLAWMVVGYFALFDLGIGLATTKFVAEFLGKDKAARLPELIWTAIVSQLCLGTAAGVLLAAASPLLARHLLAIPTGLQGQAQWVFLILAFSLPVSLVSGSLQGVLAASQRFDLFNAVGVSSSVLTYLVPVAALGLGFGLPAIVLVLVLARVAALVVSFLLCQHLYPAFGAGLRFDRGLVMPLLGFGGWLTVSGAVGGVLLYFDKFLLGSVVSMASVGFYTPPYLIASKLNILPGSLTTTLFPALSAAAGRGNDGWIRDAFVRSLKLLLVAVGPAAVVLIFFARPLLTIWLGTKFATEGTVALQILAVGVLANSLAFVPYDLLQAIGRPDLTGKFRLIELPLHVGLAWFLAVRYGLVGVALAFSFSRCLDLLLLVTAACRLTGTSLHLLAGRGLRRCAGTLGTLAVGLLVVCTSARALSTEAGFVVLLGGAFVLATWGYVLDAEEKWQIRLWLRGNT